MGGWDEYCTVCAGPTSVPRFEVVDEEGQSLTPPLPNPADYTWLESLIGISSKEELIPLAFYADCGGFNVQPDTTPYTSFTVGCRDEDFYEKEARGYACHVSCYNFLQQELNYTLKYADVLPLLVGNDYTFNTFSWSDYGGLAEYHEQYFDGGEVLLVKDGKLWMIEDPSRDEQNKERILQVWRPLVESGFKRPEARVGDESSAPQTADAISTLSLEEHLAAPVQSPHSKASPTTDPEAQTNSPALPK